MPILRGYSAVVLAVGALVTALLAYFIFGPYWTKLVLDVLLLGAAVVVSLTWLSAAVEAVKNGARDAGDKIVLTVWVSWTALLGQRIYALVVSFLRANNPQSSTATQLMESPIPIMVGTLILIAGAYASYATVAETHVPLREQRYVLIASFIGGMVVGGTLIAAILFNLHF